MNVYISSKALWQCSLTNPGLIGNQKITCWELEQFKQECSVLFQGPLSEMKDAQKAGLVINWIGRQCVMTLHSMGIELDKPKTVFDSLEKIFSSRKQSNT